MSLSNLAYFDGTKIFSSLVFREVRKKYACTYFTNHFYHCPLNGVVFSSNVVADRINESSP